MPKNLVLLLLLLTAAGMQNALAGNDNPPIGARAAGLSGAAVTLPDVWALRNNIAGIAELKETQLGTHFENRFGISAFNSVAFAAAFPTQSHGTFGLEAYRFGDNLYSNQRVGIGTA